LARISEDFNVHGSISFDYFACTDDAYDQSRLVLWVGGSGAQEDDGIARLEPISWIEDIDQLDDDGSYVPFDDPEILAALLMVTLSEWFNADWLDPEEKLLEAGDVLD